MKENEENLIEQYAIGENEYDLTKEKDFDKVFKVYKSLHEDDLISIVKTKKDINDLIKTNNEKID